MKPVWEDFIRENNLENMKKMSEISETGMGTFY